MVEFHLLVLTRFSLSMEMSRLTRDGTAEPVSRDQILRHAQGQGNVHFPCWADHEQDWQPYPVDPYSAICDDHTYIHTYSPRSHAFRYYYEGRSQNKNLASSVKNGTCDLRAINSILIILIPGILLIVVCEFTTTTTPLGRRHHTYHSLIKDIH